MTRLISAALPAFVDHRRRQRHWARNQGHSCRNLRGRWPSVHVPEHRNEMSCSQNCDNPAGWDSRSVATATSVVTRIGFAIALALVTFITACELVIAKTTAQASALLVRALYRRMCRHTPGAAIGAGCKADLRVL